MWGDKDSGGSQRQAGAGLRAVKEKGRSTGSWIIKAPLSPELLVVELNILEVLVLEAVLNMPPPPVFMPPKVWR